MDHPGQTDGTLDDLEYRAVTSSFLSVIARILRLAITFGRSIVLARILAPQTFGVYTLALSIITITFSLANALLTGPFLHDSPHSRGEVGASTHFVLNLGISSLLAVLLAGFALIFGDPANRLVYMSLILGFFLQQLTITQQTLLVKQVAFRRIAIGETVAAIAATFASIWLARNSSDIWSLVSITVVYSVLIFVIYDVVKPPWNMRFAWYAQSVQYFVAFGSRTFVAGVLGIMLDRLDDVWTGIYLGPTPLGYYSKAYELATYPRSLIAMPLNQVAAGTYAALKHYRRRLSEAFIRYNQTLVRAGFAVAGVSALVVTEFVTLAIGNKWMPIVPVFRLMLVFSMLDPIKITIASVLVAVGEPEKVGYARMIQLGVLVAGLFAMGKRWGIVGVAIAVDLMLLVGIVILLYYASKHVTFSLRQLFAVPTLALILGLGAGLGVIACPGLNGSDLSLAIWKTLAFSIVYSLVILALDRSFLLDIMGYLRGTIHRKTRQESDL